MEKDFPGGSEMLEVHKDFPNNSQWPQPLLAKFHKNYLTGIENVNKSTYIYENN